MDTLKRECQEEIGADVTIEGLQFVREYIADNHGYFSSWTQGTHLIDFIFRCSVDEGYDASTAPAGDSIQVGIKWMSIDELKKLRFYPKALLDYLCESGPESPPVYLELYVVPVKGFALMGAAPPACNTASALQSLRSFGPSGTGSFVTLFAKDNGADNAPIQLRRIGSRRRRQTLNGLGEDSL